MRSVSTSGTTRLAVVAASLAAVAAVAVALVPVGLGADSSGLRLRANEARTQESSAASRAQAAVLTLYALETELSEARASIAAAEARRAALARERASARHRLELARRATRISETRLAELVRTLYVQEGADPLAVLLGAGSLDEALVGLDNLERAAVDNRRILEQASSTRARLEQLAARFDARDAELAHVSEAAQRRLLALEAKLAERAAYIDSLERRQGLAGQRLAALEAQARAAGRRTEALTTPGRLPAALEPAAPVATSGQTLTVSAVGYSLPGRTASGLPAGHGAVAVDPSVIPLGTRFFVPGYGEAVAADTGGAVLGAVIDLWFPTPAAARRWGRRTVSIAIR
ncbi:MAG: 3D domain-containing protein [Gaiellaceae bacterium MAG52_C11]|nr:3D domain-containing protein [Candidatus Gaiellasilicea maunaloa]